MVEMICGDGKNKENEGGKEIKEMREVTGNGDKRKKRRRRKTQLNWVFVLDKHKKPLMPCHPARARKLLKKGRAVVHRLYPFTIRLKDRTVGESVLQDIEEGNYSTSTFTGKALVREDGFVLFSAIIEHRNDIPTSLTRRRNYRRSRRSRLRYRAPRFNNRRRPKGWLTPTLRSKINNVCSWSLRLSKLAPITGYTVATTKFDTQKLQNPEIRGVEYQHGTLYGYEVKEYLLEKYNHQCVYCKGESGDKILEIDHVIPKIRGGTDRITNLVIACRTCNRLKGNKTAEEFGFPEVQKQCKKPLKSAGHMNAMRYAIVEAMKKVAGSNVRTTTFAAVKFVRNKLGLPNQPHINAMCAFTYLEKSKTEVEEEEEENQSKQTKQARVMVDKPFRFKLKNIQKPLLIKAKGRGKHQRCLSQPTKKTKKPRIASRKKMYYGFQSGDMVKAVIPKGKYKGVYTGIVAVRSSGYFDLKDFNGRRVAQGISYRHFRLIQRFDGYVYSFGDGCNSPGTIRNSSY